MKGVTAIEKTWLPKLSEGTPLCKYSEPLETPQPSYDPQTDRIYCQVIPSYGPYHWNLPPYQVCFFVVLPFHRSNIHQIWAITSGLLILCLLEKSFLSSIDSLIFMYWVQRISSKILHQEECWVWFKFWCRTRSIPKLRCWRNGSRILLLWSMILSLGFCLVIILFWKNVGMIWFMMFHIVNNLCT